MTKPRVILNTTEHPPYRKDAGQFRLWVRSVEERAVCVTCWRNVSDTEMRMAFYLHNLIGGGVLATEFR